MIMMLKKVKASPVITSKSDMFSLGITILGAIFPDSPKPTTQDRTNGSIKIPTTDRRSESISSLIDILRRLLNKDPKSRPPAFEVLSSRYFSKPMKDDIPPMKLPCLICFEESELSEGINLCGDQQQKHFYCFQCIEKYVTTLNSQSPDEIEKRQGKIPCPSFSGGCDRFIPIEALARVVHPGTLNNLIKNLGKISEMKVVRELEADFQRRLQREKQAENIQQQVQRLGQDIIENIL